MEPWQIGLLVFLLVVPLLLSIATWGDERLSFRGRPLLRDWRGPVAPVPEDDHH